MVLCAAMSIYPHSSDDASGWQNHGLAFSRDPYEYHHTSHTQRQYISDKQMEDFCRARYSASYTTASVSSHPAAWTLEDFQSIARLMSYHAIQEGKMMTEADVAREMLSSYNYYLMPGFQVYIKTCAGYTEHIKKIHANLEASKGWCYGLRKLCGLIDDAQLREVVDRLHAEIVEQEGYEREQILQEELRKAIVSQQQNVRHTYEQQRQDLYQLANEWNEHESDDRYKKRIQALQVMSQDTYPTYTTKQYVISSAVTQVILQTGSEIRLYRSCYGNELQQVLHQECISGIEQLATLGNSSTLYDHKHALVECFDAARDYNQSGNVCHAAMVADFCWAVLDCGKAVAEGVAQGLMLCAQDAFNYPLQTATFVGASELYSLIRWPICYTMLLILALPTLIITLLE